MLVAIILGMIFGAGLSWPISRWVIRKVADRFAPSSQGRRFVTVCAAVFVAISLAPAIFLSVMGTGSFAGPMARRLAESLGMTGIVWLAVTLQVTLAVLILIISHAIFGAGLGALAARSLGSVERGSSLPSSNGTGGN